MTDERDQLPPGWVVSERGPVSPKSGRVFSVIPAGWEWADLDMLEDMLDRLFGADSAVGSAVPDSDPAAD